MGLVLAFGSVVNCTGTVMRLILVTALLALLAVACGGDDEHRHPQLKTGKQLYMHHCASCHQNAGGGAFMRGIPPVKDTSMTYREMTDHVRGRNRIEGSRMPAFATMPKAEAEAISIYIRNKLKAG